jgi:signal transduction histidine kinase
MAFSALHALFVTLVSIRERNRLNDRAVKYRTDAIEAEKANAAKSQFLATMSHELRTPLNAVIGYAEIMQEDLEDGRMASPDDAKRIVGAGRNLLGLINDVLDLSKIEAGKMQVDLAPASIGEVVRTVSDLCAHIAEKNGNTLTVSIDAKIGDVVTDAARLRQCVLNLVSNACKFTTDGQVRVSASRVDDRVRIEVSDTGIGISDEQAARLFRPFEQADSSTTRKYGGTGLGLAITKKLCELLGGDVELKSTLGRGTTITLWLPLTPAELAQAKAA